MSRKKETPDRLEKLLANLEPIQSNFTIGERKLEPGAIDKYKDYLRALDKANGGKTLSWIEKAHKATNDKKSGNFGIPVVDIVTETFNNFKGNRDTIENEKTSNIDLALQYLTKAFLSFFDGEFSVAFNTYITDEMLANMVAETAIFASYDIVKSVVKGGKGYKANEFASADNCEHRRKNVGEERREVKIEDGSQVTLDDNTIPNRKLKEAICKGLKLNSVKWNQFNNYVVCHIWDNPYDRRAFCSLVNLVLLPKAIYGLSDHHKLVKKILQQRSYDLYKTIEGIKFPFEYLSLPEPSLKGDEKKIYDSLESKWRELI